MVDASIRYVVAWSEGKQYISMPARRQARHKVEVQWANDDWTSTLFDHKNMFGRVSLILNVRVCWGAL